MTIARVALFFVLTAALAFSASITWTVNATLDDGATVSGFFVFDPDLRFQTITNFNLSVSAATPGILTEPGDQNLPTSVFFPFDFTPASAVGSGPWLIAEGAPNDQDGAFEFSSDTIFANPIPGSFAEPLVLQFVPIAPLTDASSTIINNSNINVNVRSSECFDCEPYVCFSGATSAICAASTAPEAGGLSLVTFGIFGFGCILIVERRLKSRLRRTPHKWSTRPG